MSMVLNKEDFAITIRNSNYYDALLEEYLDNSSKRVRNLFWYRTESQRIEFYTGFRKWLVKTYSCYNDGTNFLYFKTEQDYIWFRLKYE